MTHADAAREAYRDDLTLTPQEYGQLVADADAQDQFEEWQAEVPNEGHSVRVDESDCTCTYGAYVRHGGGTGFDIVKFDPDCPEHGGNEDGSNRDVPPFDNDPRSDDDIKQEVYDRMNDPDFDDDHPQDWEGW